MVVANGRESREQTTDSRDAYALAVKFPTGTAGQSASRAPAQFRRLREISRVHEMLVRDVVRVQARLNATYRSRGVTTPGATVDSMTHRRQWLTTLPPARSYTATRLAVERRRTLHLQGADTQLESGAPLSSVSQSSGNASTWLRLRQTSQNPKSARQSART